MENPNFLNKKLYKNALSIDVCYWILNHFIKKKIDNKTGFEYGCQIIELDNLPTIVDYFQSIIPFLLKKIQSDYSIQEKICKYLIYKSFLVNFTEKDDFEPFIKFLQNKRSFLILQYLLNDPFDFTVKYKNNSFSQGDLFVFNGQNADTVIDLKSGEVYFLYFLVEIVS